MFPVNFVTYLSGCTMLRGSPTCCGPEKGKDIPVSIGDLEAPQSLVYERQFLYERHTALAELVEERVGVQGVDVRVPTSPFVPCVVWLWKHVGQDRLEHDADPIPAHSGVVRAVVRTLEVELEAEALAVVGDRGLQVLHDEERADRREISLRLFVLRAVRSGVCGVRAHSGSHCSVASGADHCF